MSISRRYFITGVSAFIAAPAIVRAASLMPIKVLPERLIYPSLYAELTAVTRKAMVPQLFRNLYFASPTLYTLMKDSYPTELQKICPTN